MSTLAPLLTRRALVDYARRPLNAVLLVAVPVVLVFVWGTSLTSFAELLGSAARPVQLQAATAGWAAAALAGLGGLFQITGARAVDRRLAGASGRPWPVVAGRLAACAALAGLASAGGLAALAVRSGIHDPLRAITGTVLVALIYVAIGTLAGTIVRSDMNGALLVTLMWILDVFLGPTLGGANSALTRFFPLHFPQLLLSGQRTGHAGRVGDIGWSLLWAIGLSVVAAHRLRGTTGSQGRRGHRLGGHVEPSTNVSHEPSTVAPAAPSTKGFSQSAAFPAAIRAAFRDYRRDRVLWILLVAVPAIFIGLAVMVTVDKPGPVDLVEGARRYRVMVSERRTHAATMVPVSAAFLAGLAGLFIATGSTAGDRRLVLSGMRRVHVLGARMAVIGAATALTSVTAVVVSGAWYPPRQWAEYVLATMLIATTYAMVGAVLGPLTGRLGGLYLVLLLAFVDVGLGQSVMLPDGPPRWGAFLPARGASRLLIDGAFTTRFDEGPALMTALAWLLGSAALFLVVSGYRTGRPRREWSERRRSARNYDIV